MWDGLRVTLGDLDFDERTCILDMSCRTGEFTRILAEVPGARVVDVDTDTDLLSVTSDRDNDTEMVAGDVTRLPLTAGNLDSVVCRALLMDLPDPTAALSEFTRVSSNLVATVEPNSAIVDIGSTVESKTALNRRVRDTFRDGAATDVALGDRIRGLFSGTGPSVVGTCRCHHRKLTEPPYNDHDVRSTTKKTTGEELDRHEADLRRGLDDDPYGSVRHEWRKVSRGVVQQVRDGEYHRTEAVSFNAATGWVQSGLFDGSN